MIVDSQARCYKSVDHKFNCQNLPRKLEAALCTGDKMLVSNDISLNQCKVSRKSVQEAVSVRSAQKSFQSLVMVKYASIHRSNHNQEVNYLRLIKSRLQVSQNTCLGLAIKALSTVYKSLNQGNLSRTSSLWTTLTSACLSVNVSKKIRRPKSTPFCTQTSRLI